MCFYFTCMWRKQLRETKTLETESWLLDYLVYFQCALWHDSLTAHCLTFCFLSVSLWETRWRRLTTLKSLLLWHFHCVYVSYLGSVCPVRSCWRFPWTLSGFWRLSWPPTSCWTGLGYSLQTHKLHSCHFRSFMKFYFGRTQSEKSQRSSKSSFELNLSYLI